MAEPEGMIVPLLREMRAEINARFETVDRRLAALEAAQNSFNQALSADSLLIRLEART